MRGNQKGENMKADECVQVGVDRRVDALRIWFEVNGGEYVEHILVSLPGHVESIELLVTSESVTRSQQSKGA